MPDTSEFMLDLGSGVVVDARRSFKDGFLKVEKVGSSEIHFNFKFPIVEITENYNNEELRDEFFDIITGLKKGSVG